MSDLSQRLREEASERDDEVGPTTTSAWLVRAADEIERLHSVMATGSVDEEFREDWMTEMCAIGMLERDADRALHAFEAVAARGNADA